ncbi:MAG: flagellar biosynthetic protein FliQ [Phycisphaerae bacterium]|nr:flagellar biosynthetic protein FliQ [Phycisphaerae bacterium]
MDEDMVIYLGRRTLEVAMLVAAPVLTVALVVGILTGMMQAVTSMRDMTTGMVLKLAAVGATLILTGGWVLQMAKSFTIEIFNTMQAIGH